MKKLLKILAMMTSVALVSCGGYGPVEKVDILDRPFFDDFVKHEPVKKVK